MEIINKNKISEIHSLFQSQKQHMIQIRKTSANERIKKLKLLESVILSHREAMYEGMWKDLRKPATEVDITEIYPTLTELRFAIRHIKKWMRDKRVRTPISFFGATSKIRYEPKGVCLIIAPWNYPFQLLFAPLVSAIAAGNAVILKPSEFTPNTVDVLKKIIKECFETNEIAVLEGGVDVSTELLKLKFDHIFFTGAPEIGKIIMAAASKNLSSVTLELGGKSPTIVDESADMNTSVKRIAWAKFINAGQTCIAPDYILVHESKKFEFIEKLIKQIEKDYGEKAGESDDYVRIISQKHHKRLKEYLDTSIQKGGKVVYGGEFKELDKYIQPTLVTDLPMDTDLMQLEIFGPILPILSYKEKEEVVEIITNKDKPLALYIYSKNKKNIRYFIENTTAGGTCINMSSLHVGNPHLPFGGINNSGIGKSRGHYGFIEFSNERGIFNQKIKSSIDMMTPPYTSFKQKLINLTIKYF